MPKTIEKELVCELQGVRLFVSSEDCYTVEFWECGKRREFVCFSWNEAEALFVRKVEEADNA